MMCIRPAGRERRMTDRREESRPFFRRPLTGNPRLDNLDPKGYFLDLCEKFESARRAGGGSDFFFRLGRDVFRFRFANPSLVPLLTPAFAHLQIEPQKSDVEILFWDSESAGIELSAPPWVHSRGSAVEFHGEGCFIQFDFVSEILSAWEAFGKKGVFWIQSAARLTSHETGSPLRLLLSWWEKESPLQLVHGGAVGSENAAVLLVGKGGSGKSSSCASVLQSDLYYLGDDYCLVETSPSLKVYSLYCSLRLRPDAVGRFPHLKDSFLNEDRIPDEKPLFILRGPLSAKLKKALPLKALLIPRITGKDSTQIRKAGPMDALKALAPSTIFQSIGHREGVFKKMGDWV